MILALSPLATSRTSTRKRHNNVKDVPSQLYLDDFGITTRSSRAAAAIGVERLSQDSLCGRCAMGQNCKSIVAVVLWGWSRCDS